MKLWTSIVLVSYITGAVSLFVYKGCDLWLSASYLPPPVDLC